jgi:N-acetylglucosamine kinase-like BadF-type ATPase
VLSDCQTARFGATLGSPGVVVIAGTGSIVVAGNSRSRWVRFGGWGHILGDEGSAYWIAVESVKAAIASEDRGESGGKLGRAVRRWFGVRRLTGIVPIVYRPTFRKRDLALLAEDLSKRPGAGGPVFRRICQRAGKELAGQTALAIRSAGLKSGAITVYLVGSVINCNPIVQQAFLRKLRTRRRFRVAAPILSSVFGAVAMALVDAGVTLTPALVARLEKADRQN